ncbi:MAG: hypothetical protein IKL59_05505 [Clostridia bacterium]|nr:hypothetical protein [Clostridia bacterium]
MGFGLLFIGYFAASMGFVSVLRLLGYMLTTYSAKKLKQYNTAFGYFEIASGVMVVVSFVTTVLDLLGLLMGEGFVNESVITVIRHAEVLLACACNIVMLWSIRSIAIDTEEKKISFGAVRNSVFVMIYAVAYLVSLLPFEFMKYLSLPLIIVQLVWIIFNLVLIFSCYAKICDESDVNMERKPSRFAFVNEMRAQSDARQKEKEEKWAERAEQRKKRK